MDTANDSTRLQVFHSQLKLLVPKLAKLKSEVDETGENFLIGAKRQESCFCLKVSTFLGKKTLGLKSRLTFSQAKLFKAT